jgi:predicted HicB family RNase H-like nuclease
MKRKANPSKSSMDRHATIRFPGDVYRAVIKAAERDHRTLNSFVVAACAHFVEVVNSRSRPLPKGE